MSAKKQKKKLVKFKNCRDFLNADKGQIESIGMKYIYANDDHPSTLSDIEVTIANSFHGVDLNFHTGEWYSDDNKKQVLDSSMMKATILIEYFEKVKLALQEYKDSVKN